MQYMDFRDLCEILCRIADCILLPTDEDIKASGEKDIISYMKQCERTGKLLKRRPSAHSIVSHSQRGFGEKLDKFLRIFYYALYPEGNGYIPPEKHSFVVKCITKKMYPKGNRNLEGLSYCESGTSFGKRGSAYKVNEINKERRMSSSVSVQNIGSSMHQEIKGERINNSVNSNNYPFTSEGVGRQEAIKASTKLNDS